MIRFYSDILNAGHVVKYMVIHAEILWQKINLCSLIYSREAVLSVCQSSSVSLHNVSCTYMFETTDRSCQSSWPVHITTPVKGLAMTWNHISCHSTSLNIWFQFAIKILWNYRIQKNPNKYAGKHKINMKWHFFILIKTLNHPPPPPPKNLLSAKNNI